MVQYNKPAIFETEIIYISLNIKITETALLLIILVKSLLFSLNNFENIHISNQTHFHSKSNTITLSFKKHLKEF